MPSLEALYQQRKTEAHGTLIPTRQGSWESTGTRALFQSNRTKKTEFLSPAKASTYLRGSPFIESFGNTVAIHSSHSRPYIQGEAQVQCLLTSKATNTPSNRERHASRVDAMHGSVKKTGDKRSS